MLIKTVKLQLTVQARGGHLGFLTSGWWESPDVLSRKSDYKGIPVDISGWELGIPDFPIQLGRSLIIKQQLKNVSVAREELRLQLYA